jgi:cation diffusion facilitator CzcD-associated flavoprotein CzcO
VTGPLNDDDLTVDPDLAKTLRERYAAERAKRIGANEHHSGHGRYLAMEGDLAHYADDPHSEVVPREPRKEKTRVLIVGAGFGGLLMSARLRDRGIDDFLILDASGDVGGVWYWNWYPGASCDIDAYTYLPLLEETGFMPSERYAGQPEIQGYAQLVARQYGVYEKALFHTRANSIVFDDESGLWRMTTDRGDELTADFVVLATGGAYSKPRLPDIEGIEAFQGASFHSSRWDYDYTGGRPGEPMVNLADKKVAIIGTGASALQIIPRIAHDVQELYVVQRTPSTVAERKNGPTDPEWFKSQPPGWHVKRRVNFAAITRGGPIEEDLIQDGWSAMYWELALPGLDPDLDDAGRAEALRLADMAKMERIRARVDAIVKDPVTSEALKPYYSYHCKRPGFHETFLDTFNLPNVHLIDASRAGVDRISPEGVVVNGVEYQVDCIVHATGFMTHDDPYTTRLGFDIIGPKGASLTEKWSEGAETFQGMFTQGFPNLFLFPDAKQQVAASVSFMYTLVEYSEHAAYVIESLEKEGKHYVDVVPEAEEQWVATVVESAQKMMGVVSDCTPGRANTQGRVNPFPKGSTYPMKTVEFFDRLADWRAAGDHQGLVFS